MLTKTTRIMAAVSGHWLLGSLPLQNRRIQEALNDCSTEFVELQDVEVYSHAKRECFANLKSATVPKSKLEFIIEPTGTHEAPQKRLSNRAAKAHFSCFVIVNEYRIQGTLHLPSTGLDPRRALMHQAGKFFPLTQASLGYDGRGVQQLSVPLVLANKDFVSCFEVGDRVDQECPSVGRETSLEPQVGTLEDESLARLLENVHGLLDSSLAQTE